MKMNKKGFTLIELLAVIVILAVIALIAVPQVLKILNQARESAAEDSAYGVLESASSYVATYMLNNQGDWEGTMVFDCNGKDSNNKSLKKCCTKENNAYTSNCLEIKGTAPTAGAIRLNADQSVEISEELEINHFYCIEESDGKIDCKSSRHSS